MSNDIERMFFARIEWINLISSPMTPFELQADAHLALRHGDCTPLAMGALQGPALRTFGALVLLVGQHPLQSEPKINSD